MSTQKQWGFTIIELMLFLGITGALFAGLMIGVNNSLNQQHYKESVSSYKSILEKQFSEVMNPRNYRDDGWKCSAGDGIEVTADGQARGTSDCIIMGRYIEVGDDGSHVETGDVVGIEPTGAGPVVGDLAALTSYSPQRSQVNVTQYDIDWQSKLRTDTGGTSTASYMILRAPTSGLIRVFGQSSPLPAILASMITEDAAQSIIKSCVIGSGSIGLPTQSVSINAAIAGPNGVVVNVRDPEC